MAKDYQEEASLDLHVLPIIRYSSIICVPNSNALERDLHIIKRVEHIYIYKEGQSSKNISPIKGNVKYSNTPLQDGVPEITQILLYR